MIDRSTVDNALLIADRGYESYNLMAHCQEKGWKFLFRIKDVASSNGIAKGLASPDADEFDYPVTHSISTKQTNHTKSLFKQSDFLNLFRLNLVSIIFLRKIINIHLLSFMIFLFVLSALNFLTILMKLLLQILVLLISLLWN